MFRSSLAMIFLFGAFAALAGCHAPMSQFNPLASYGPAVAPPPATGTYGQGAPYYGGAAGAGAYRANPATAPQGIGRRIFGPAPPATGAPLPGTIPPGAAPGGIAPGGIAPGAPPGSLPPTLTPNPYAPSAAYPGANPAGYPGYASQPARYGSPGAYPAAPAAYGATIPAGGAPYGGSSAGWQASPRSDVPNYGAASASYETAAAPAYGTGIREAAPRVFEGASGASPLQFQGMRVNDATAPQYFQPSDQSAPMGNYAPGSTGGPVGVIRSGSLYPPSSAIGPSAWRTLPAEMREGTFVAEDFTPASIPTEFRAVPSAEGEPSNASPQPGSHSVPGSIPATVDAGGSPRFVARRWGG